MGSRLGGLGLAHPWRRGRSAIAGWRQLRDLDIAPAIWRAPELSKVAVVAGQAEQVNRSTGECGLLTDHGVKTGKVAPSGPDLDRLQVGKHYRFKCAEFTEQDALCVNARRSTCQASKPPEPG